MALTIASGATEKNTRTLMKVGLANGFGIHVLEPYMVQGQIVQQHDYQEFHIKRSSGSMPGFYGSLLQLARKGDHRKQIWKDFGFPTLNISIDEDMVCPADGIYVTYCNYDGIRYPSVTNVGVRPTVCNTRARNMETHIFNFNKEIYGEEVRVEFLEMLRRKSCSGTWRSWLYRSRRTA